MGGDPPIAPPNNRHCLTLCIMASHYVQTVFEKSNEFNFAEFDGSFIIIIFFIKYLLLILLIINDFSSVIFTYICSGTLALFVYCDFESLLFYIFCFIPFIRFFHDRTNNFNFVKNMFYTDN